MTERILYVDLETTGLDEKVNGVIQIATIYEVDGKEIDRFSSFVAPGPTDRVDATALEKNGHTESEIRGFEPPVVVASKLVNFLTKYIKPYDKEDKVYFCAYNAEFDFKFLHAFMHKYAQFSLGNFCWGYKLDPYMFACYLRALGKLNTENLKLGTLTKYFNITHSSQHDAISDIEAARELFKYFKKVFPAEVAVK